jgi:drug/metabolite transporter (DMT)-like permease
MNRWSNNTAPDRTTLALFALLVVIGGSNAVAVRFSNLELPPLWGATIRFAAAALVFWVIALARRTRVPGGRVLLQLMIFGLLSTGIAYSLLYTGLVRISAGLTMTVLAFVPLLTFFLAVLHGQEKFRWRGLLGALISLAGIQVAVRSGLGGGIHIPSLLGIAAAAVVMSEGNVFFKFIPPTDPFLTNAVATSTGAVFLLAVSLAAGEAWSIPAARETWISFIYLVLIGSVLLFYLYLYVLSRWTASATAYAFLLFPVSTVIIAAVLAGETVSTAFITGAALVMVGVWTGAFRPSR